MTKIDQDALFAVARKERERQRKAVEAKVDAIILAVSEASGMPVDKILAKAAPERPNLVRYVALALAGAHCNGIYPHHALAAKFNVSHAMVIYAKKAIAETCKAAELYQRLYGEQGVGNK